jgi:hypothetical protein
MKYNRLTYYIPKFKVEAKTYGNGLWSNECRKILHRRAAIEFFSEESANDFKFAEFKSNFAELRVYFPKKCWDTKKHGLIYTDKNWIKEFRAGLINLGFSNIAVKGIDYSEAGMQGRNYVSLDVNKKFMKEASRIIFNKDKISNTNKK